MGGRIRRLVVDTGALRESRAFRRLFTGQLITLIGRQVTVVAVPYQLYVLTGSALLLGIVGLVQAVAMIGTGFIAGPIIDTFDRRRVLLASQVLLGATAVALLLISLMAHPPVWAIVATVAVAAGLAAVEGPTRNAIIPRLVPARNLAGALSLSFGLFTVGSVAGPAVGGLLIGAWGVSAAYAVDVVTFGAALVAVLLLPAQPPEATEREPMLRSLATGLRFVRQEPAILGGFAIDLVAMVFGMPRAVFPVLAATSLHTGPGGLGWLYAAPGAGAVIGTLVTGWVGGTRRLGRVVVAAVAVWGVAITGVGLVPWLGVALGLLVVAGAADSVSAVCRTTMMQTLTPDHLRGRVNALYSMVVRSGPFLGDLEAGVVAQGFGGAAFGAEVAITSGGLLCLAGLGLAVLAIPRMWSYTATGRTAEAP
jgi:MFS family permease